jgi:tetratricopeptide (TPR) repeat protein
LSRAGCAQLIRDICRCLLEFLERTLLQPRWLNDFGQPAEGIDKSELVHPEPRRIRDKHHLRFVATQPCTERYSRDAVVLENALTTEADPFLRARYKFYLGQCYLDAGEKEKALAAFEERALLGFWDQEVFISLYRAANLKADLGFDEEEVIASYLKAHDIRKDRAEALYGAARYCRIKQKYQQGFDLANQALKIKPPHAGLFLEDWIYRYALLDEFAVNAYGIGCYSECVKACTRLLNEGRTPEHFRVRVSKNAELARNKLAAQIHASPAMQTGGRTSHITDSEPKRARLNVILICGPWGSGTSVVAGLLDRLGAFGLAPYFETKDLKTANSYESMPFREIILRYASQPSLSLIPCAPGALQSDLQSLQTRIEEQEFGPYDLHSPKPIFLKYPLSALLIPQICEVFDTKLIYVIRPLEDIARTQEQASKLVWRFLHFDRLATKGAVIFLRDEHRQSLCIRATRVRTGAPAFGYPDL